jgi:hypothetical protein
MGILNFGKFSLCYSTKRKLAGVGYTGESGLLGVAYARESGLTGVGYTGKFELCDVAYTGEYRSSVWPTQRTPQKNFSHKESPA